jgi:hypothetical protein
MSLTAGSSAAKRLDRRPPPKEETLGEVQMAGSWVGVASQQAMATQDSETATDMEVTGIRMAAGIPLMVVTEMVYRLHRQWKNADQLGEETIALIRDYHDLLRQQTIPLSIMMVDDLIGQMATAHALGIWNVIVRLPEAGAVRRTSIPTYPATVQTLGDLHEMIVH